MGNILIIAEAGVNHNGNFGIACRMVDEAKKAGADIVKFQTGKPENVISRYAPKAEYQKRNTGSGENQLDMVRKIMLSYEDFGRLKDYCEKAGIKFLTTPFDIESVRFVDKLVDIWKIPSGEITNYPYLAEIAKTGKDIILSTGMSTLEEVGAAMCVLKSGDAGKIILLHCTTDYPASIQEVNLRGMLTLKEKFGCAVGYSDHTLGTEVSVAAVAMGATVIEKHFTLDKTMEGPDHKASLEPEEFALMVKAIRNVEQALGDGIKRPSVQETANIAVVRKSIIAARLINKGELLTEENLTTKRPGTGISPMKWNEVIGMKAKRDFAEDELIEI